MSLNIIFFMEFGKMLFYLVEILRLDSRIPLQSGTAFVVNIENTIVQPVIYPFGPTGTNKGVNHIGFFGAGGNIIGIIVTVPETVAEPCSAAPAIPWKAPERNGSRDRQVLIPAPFS